MKTSTSTSNVLRRVYGVAAALIGVLFFFIIFIIVGVCGLPLAIAGLAADSVRDSTKPFLPNFNRQNDLR
jgi:hypothetical protein